MKTKHITTLAIALLGATCPTFAESESKFQKDRKAILAMAGSYEVHFHFEESYPIAIGYKLQKPYDETARELVKVVRDEGRRIVLQHLLVVGNNEDIKVIKHWGQIWTYEDETLLDYKSGDKWISVQLDPGSTKGEWSQLVTQTDDSPRYEGSGIWRHTGSSSEWISGITSRPLPRREYTKRDDYDILTAENRHVVTPNGWSHFQLNKKRYDNSGEAHYLCIETGLNTYTKIEPSALASAETWWQENSEFWIPVAEAWLAAADSGKSIDLRPKGHNKTYAREIKELRRQTEDSSSNGLTELISRFTTSN